MPDFMFRNLSVKLYPVETHDVGNCTDRTTQVDCWPFQTQCGCTNLCTMTHVPCGPHTCYAPTVPIACDPDSHQFVCNGATNPCGPDSQGIAFVDQESRVIIPPGADPREQLELLRANLQRSAAAVDARLEEVQQAARPTSVEQIDALKAQLLAAVDELDQQRAQLAGGGDDQAPAEG
jgi:hypothetical protein